jgi:site-specific recombinase XerD
MATKEDLRRFQLHLAQQQISPGSINAAVAALRFFFTVTLERPDLVRPLPTVNKPRKAPVVLSQEEVALLLEAAPGLKYKAALSVAYGAGLRVSEVAHLKVSDIDSQRMTLRVEQGKGRRSSRRSIRAFAFGGMGSPSGWRAQFNCSRRSRRKADRQPPGR